MKYLVFTVLSLSSLFLGYVLHGFSSLEESGESSSSQSSPRTMVRTSSRVASEHAKGVWCYFENSRDQSGWAHLIAGIENSDLNELIQLTILTAGDRNALEMIGRYWAEKDPAHLYRTLLEKSPNGVAYEKEFPAKALIWMLFETWTQKDPDAAIAALASGDAIPSKQYYRYYTLHYLMKVDPARGFALMKQWNHRRDPVLNLPALSKWADQDPHAALTALLNCPQSHGLAEHVHAIAQQWAKINPQAALASIRSAAGNMTLTAQEAVIKEWAKKDFDAAADWAASQEDSRAHARLTASLISMWSQENEAEALAWSRENLQGRALAHSLAEIVKQRVGKDLPAAVALLAEVPKTAKKIEVGVDLGKRWFKQDLNSQGSITSDFKNWFQSIDQPELQANLLKQIDYEWASKDREGMMNFLLQATLDPKAVSGLYGPVYELVKQDPEATLARLLSSSGETSGTLATHAYTGWEILQPQAAKKWLKKYRQSHPDDTRLSDGKSNPVVEGD